MGINGSMLEYRLIDYDFPQPVQNLLLTLEKKSDTPSIYERVYGTFFSPGLSNDQPEFKQERLKLLIILFEKGILKPDRPDILETVQHELGRLSKAFQLCENNNYSEADKMLKEPFSIALFGDIAVDFSINDIFPQLDIGFLRMFA